MEKQVQQLVSELHHGQVSRRAFLKRATLILGSVAAANALLLAASGAPIQQVAEAAGALEGTAPATPPAAAASVEGGMEIQTAMVTFNGNGDTPGYLARPTASGSFPAVVIVQEWWGLDDHIVSLVQRFASAGYVALAPDLYRGKVAKEPNDAMRLVMTVQTDKALLDIQGAVDYLNQQDFVMPHKAGVLGFCFGGGLAMRMSYGGKNVGAVVVFYGAGVNPTDDDFKAVSVPVLGLYGDKDPNFTVAQINGWGAKFKQYGKINEMVIYPGAPHAFFNDTRSSYRKDAATDAWGRTQAWFQKYLVADARVATMAATAQ